MMDKYSAMGLFGLIVSCILFPINFFKGDNVLMLINIIGIITGIIAVSLPTNE